MRLRSCVPLLIALSIILAITACRSTLAVPTQMHDGWRTGSLAEAGIKEKPLASLADRIERGRIPNIHGILIVKGGKLVFEKYFEGYRFAYDKALFQGTAVHYDAYTAHNTMSITKAVTAATVGIAIDQVLIGDEQQRISTYFPEYSHLFDEQKRRITIGHLPTMSSGLQWNEWDEPLTSRDNDLIQPFIVPDPVGYILAKPAAHEPGSYW